MTHSEHLYNEMLKSLQGALQPALGRQHSVIIPWIDNAIQSIGLSETSSYLNEIIEFSKYYDSDTRPEFGSLVSALNDGRENGITSSAGAAFSKYVSDIADEGLIHSYSVTSDGQGNEAFERRDNPTFKEESQPPSELQQALAHQQQKLGASETMGDGNGFRSAQKSIAMIEHQMGIDPTPQAPTPEGLSDDMEIEYHD